MKLITYIPANAYKKQKSILKEVKISEDIVFFSRGRDALLYYLKENLDYDKNIIFPSYYCSSTSSLIEGHGFKIEWIDIDYNLEYNLESVELHFKSSKISAIIICNYFGWKSKQISSLISLSNKYFVKVIIDSCHLPIESIKYGSDGVCIIGSLRKIYPLYDGGVLNYRNGSNCNIFKINRWISIKKRLYLFLKYILGLLNLNIIPIIDFINSNKYVNKDNLYQSTPIFPNVLIFPFFESFVLRNKIYNSRRSNFFVLRDLIKNSKINLLLDDLNVDDIPLNLPLRVNNASNLLIYLRNYGIEAYIWLIDDFPPMIKNNFKLFPVANILSNSVLCLPLHQNLSKTQLQYIADKLNEWKI
jgi:dTDP-4-amino-4,6-dideoxygalactose transaminase